MFHDFWGRPHGSRTDLARICRLPHRIMEKWQRGGAVVLTGEGGQVLRNKPAGHLVRTKLEGVDEGGVAAGFAVLSSPLAARDTC